MSVVYSNGSTTPGTLLKIMPITQSAMTATMTITIMPPLCHAPSRSFALDHSPRFAAAAEPTSQSASMRNTHATTSQPNQPQNAVSTASAAVIHALMFTRILFSIRCSLLSVCNCVS